MIKIINSNFSPEEWNKYAINPLQSWEWGETRKKTGTEILRFGLFDKNKLVDVYLMTLHKLPYTKYKVGYIPRSKIPSKDALNFFKDYGKSNNLIFIKFEPYEEKNKIGAKKLADLKRSSHPLFPDWTMILDLSPSEEELLKNMKSKTRYNIRLAQKKGVTIKEMTNEEGFEIFSKLYFDTTRRQKYLGHSLDYHRTVFNNLKGKIAHILIAFYEKMPLAAYELFIFKDRAYYPYGGSSVENKNVMAPNLLMWEAVRFSKEKGARYFDMWGSAAPESSQNDTYAGFTRFKEGYGTKYMQTVGSLDLVINPLIYSIYTFVYKVRYLYFAKTL